MKGSASEEAQGQMKLHESAIFPELSNLRLQENITTSVHTNSERVADISLLR